MNSRLLSSALTLFAVVTGASANVEVRRLPEQAMQPVAATDPNGNAHLVWLQGDPKACDVYYQKLPGGRTNGAVPIRVNRNPGDAIAVGTVRGAQLAIGRAGQVHVVWNGSSAAEPKATEGVPLLYARLDPSRQQFEPERNLMGATALLDGGASVAADRNGNVYVVWHGAPSLDRRNESERRVFLAQSRDDGATFQSERSISLNDGVCGCCGLRVGTDRAGHVFVLYRAAPALNDRPMTLLSSSDQGATFAKMLTDSWPTGACPMSTAALADSPSGIWAAWETRGKVRAALVRPDARDVPTITPVTASDGSKHPAFAVNARGEVICAWAEGTGWQKGGQVGWRLLDAQGRPAGDVSFQAGLPVWSFPAVFARDDGKFVLMF
jgi:hypothetical protein